jgi:hypothetical protein
MPQADNDGAPLALLESLFIALFALLELLSTATLRGNNAGCAARRIRPTFPDA